MWLQCEGGTKHHPFGKGSLSSLTDTNSFQIFQLPISPEANAATESGEPLCLGRPDCATEELESFHLLANSVSRELLRVQYGDTEAQEYLRFPNKPSEDFLVSTVQLSIDKATTPACMVLRFFSSAGAIQQKLHPAALRSRDPKTGDSIVDSPFLDKIEPVNNDSVEVNHSTGKSKTSPSLTPVSVSRKGRYGFAVQWADGATIIYSKLCLALAAGGEVSTK